MNEQLKEQIQNVRRKIPDQSLVVYDLTSGVDFSNPKETGEALAEVFFNFDVSRWIKSKDLELTFEPTDKVKIKINDDHSKKLEKTVEDFKKDLNKDEIRKEYAHEIEAAANQRMSVIGYYSYGGIGQMISSAIIKSEQRHKAAMEILKQVMANVEIETVNSA